MKYTNWIGLLSAIVVVIICYVPWIYVPSANLEIAGMYASSKQNFGRPGLVNIIMSVGAAIMFIIPFIWAKRTNIFLCGFNIAWTIRNYILLSRCYGGDCPEKKAGLYILMIASVLMLLATFFADVKMKEKN